ncbi:hypothetical protein C8Q72DRAFT_507133 [Fomitopsis betulina]|nr:hypothetical protein C8Q72DRAFT_507133 [Fomitopsis betulina]
MVPGLWSLSAAFVTDLYITSILCYTLNHQKRGIQRTDSILTRLVIYTINRGAILCLASFVAIVLWVIDSKRGTAYTEAISAPGQGTLYANALLAVLNVRNHLGHLEAPAACDMDTTQSQNMTAQVHLPWARSTHDGLPRFVMAAPLEAVRVVT